MQLDTTVLNEVVTGYAIRKERELLGYAVSTINAEQVNGKSNKEQNRFTKPNTGEKRRA